MLTIDGKNARNLKKMFSYIPDKVFPSILFKVTIDEKRNVPLLQFSDIDINQTLVVNIETVLENISVEEIEEQTFRLPLSKAVRTLFKSFDTFVIEDNSIRGVSDRKEVSLSMLINTDDEEYVFPNNIEGFLEYTKEMNEMDEVLNVWVDLTKETIAELLNCIDILDAKEDELVMNFSISSKLSNIVIASKDNCGNNFKYILPDIKVPETFKTKYDMYFLALLRTLRNSDKDIETFRCALSNVLFGTSFDDGDVKIMMAVTIFEKID